MNQNPGSPFDDAVNPYAVDVSLSGHKPRTDRGLIPQLVPLGICMIIQGALEGLLGIMMGVLAFLFPTIAARQGNQQLPANLQPMVQAVYAGIGFVLVLVAALHILAGIQIMRYQGRVLAFAALGSGFLTIFGCYCIPTAIALFVWGLIVLLNGPVQTAFRLRAEGYSKVDIDQMLN
ncbi:MAG: hypothetical protein AAFU85_14605 [Planctomycetota bacterium]